MEELGIGGHLSNMAVSPVPGNPISMNLILVILIADAALYLFLALYIENVFPGGDGVGRPFYFLFTKSYWCGADPSSDTLVEPKPSSMDPQKFEAEPDGTYVFFPKNLCLQMSWKVRMQNILDSLVVSMLYLSRVTLVRSQASQSFSDRGSL